MKRLQCAVAESTVLGFGLSALDQQLVRSLLPSEVSFEVVNRLQDLIAGVRGAAAPMLIYRLPHPASPLAHAAVVTHGATTPRVLTQELHTAMSLPRLQLPTVALCHGESLDLAFVGALRALRHVRIFSTDAPGAAQVLWPFLERALAASIGRRLFASIRDIENPLVAKAMTVALPMAGRCLPVKDVALALGIHERTLRKRLLRADAPSPQWLVGWARLLVAAWHLRDSARSASDVAAQLEFSASQNLCRMVRRYTGRSLRAFRAEDPVEVAARCVVDNGGRPTWLTETRPESTR